MKKQLTSFKNAIRGLWNTIKSESHMRFHMVAAFYVILFSFFYSFSVLQWAVLVLTISFVLMLEVLNTSIEHLCNLCADRYEPLVKIIKDCASGAVLISAISAAVIAVLFFWDLRVLKSIAVFFINNPLLLVLLILSAIASAVFVVVGPVKIKSDILNIKNKKRDKANH